MRDISAAFLTKLQLKGTAAFRTLITIDTPTPLRRVLHHDDFVWAGNTYTATTGGVSEMKQVSDGSRPAFSLTLQNVSDGTNDVPWSTYLADNEINGKEITILLVDADTTGSTATIAEEKWYASGRRLDKDLVIRCGQPHDAIAFQVPRFPLASKTSGWDSSLGIVKAGWPRTLEGLIETLGAGKPIPHGPSYPLFAKGRR